MWLLKILKGYGYEGIRTLLFANDILAVEKKHMPMLTIWVRVCCWVEHAETGIQSDRTLQARVVTLKNKIMLIVN